MPRLLRQVQGFATLLRSTLGFIGKAIMLSAPPAVENLAHLADFQLSFSWSENEPINILLACPRMKVKFLHLLSLDRRRSCQRERRPNSYHNDPKNGSLIVSDLYDFVRNLKRNVSSLNYIFFNLTFINPHYVAGICIIKSYIHHK